LSHCRCAGKILGFGGQAEIAVADVSDEQAYVSALQATAQRHGRLDILVNNAMAYTWGDIDKMTTADWHANFATTVDGTFFGTRTAMRLMKSRAAVRSSTSPRSAGCSVPRRWPVTRRPRRQ
jgi:NAD(P)-dependent dehydrogenase (short-subunit alcohol dehydrogenase family)